MKRALERRLGSLCTDISTGYINVDKLDSALYFAKRVRVIMFKQVKMKTSGSPILINTEYTWH